MNENKLYEIEQLVRLRIFIKTQRHKMNTTFMSGGSSMLSPNADVYRDILDCAEAYIKIKLEELKED